MNDSPKLFASVLLLFIVLMGCAGGMARTKKIDTIIQTARSYRGTPYKFGGTTRAGIDCSALLYHSFNSVNIRLPRTSEDQAKKGEKVKRRDLKVGDMVFFATGKRKRKINHAGIVTSVRGREVRFIHSSSSIGVTESNLSSEYYAKRFIRARRVL